MSRPATTLRTLATSGLMSLAFAHQVMAQIIGTHQEANVSVVIEPEENKKLAYSHVAARKAGGKEGVKLAIDLLITNHGDSPVSLETVVVRFLGPPHATPMAYEFGHVSIRPGLTETVRLREQKNPPPGKPQFIRLPYPPPPTARIEMTFGGYNTPTVEERRLVAHFNSAPGPAQRAPDSSVSAGDEELNETLDGLEGVGSRAAATNAFTTLPTISDDDTLSPRAAAARHGTHRTHSFRQFVQRWRQHNAAAMRLVDVDVFQGTGGSVQLFGVWEPGEESYALYRYNRKDVFMARVETQRSSNSQLIDLEVVTIGNKTWYYGVWLGEGDVDPLTQSSSWPDFQSLHTQRTAQGQRLVDVELSVESGQTQYWGVWAARPALVPQQQLLHGASRQAFGQAYAEARQQGARLQDLAGVHKPDGSQEYVGITDQVSGPWAYFVYRGWSDFRRQWAKQAEAGRSLRDLEVITRPAGGRYYIGTWGAGPPDPVDHLDAAAMATEIHRRLSGNVVGYAFAIADQSQLAIAGAGGLAQRAPDPTHKMTSRNPSTIASVTKHLTGVALLALLERNGMDPDEEILPFLPGAWDPHPSVNGLTFEHLLTHRSGFRQLLAATTVSGTGNGWDGLQTTIEQVGATPGAGRLYKNANFALQRVLIPALRRQLEGDAIAVVTEDNVRELYLDALDDLAFERLDIQDISCETPLGQIQAFAYNFEDTNRAGKSWGTTGSGCGGHANLQLNAQQLAAFLTGVRYSDHILSQASRAYMDSERAGWNRIKTVYDGTAYSHAGDYYGGFGRRTHTCVTRFPNGVDAAIIINSDTPVGACTALRVAYNAGMQ